jgi:hypothetical protein
MWSIQMSSLSGNLAIVVLGMGLTICSSSALMAAAKTANLHLNEMKCGPAALEELDEKSRQGRIEECSSQTPVLDSGTLIAPIPTIVAARKKGPKERDKTDHQRAACPPQTTSPDALTAKRRKEGPKGDVDHGCTDSNPTPDVPLLKRRKGPKGAHGSDHQG